mgnify:CR=1 FL=1
MNPIEDKFKEAQERVKKLPSQPDNDILLKLYSLYKQSTLGDASGKKPGAFDFVAKAKFEAPFSAYAGAGGVYVDVEIHGHCGRTMYGPEEFDVWVPPRPKH